MTKILGSELNKDFNQSCKFIMVLNLDVTKHVREILLSRMLILQ